jgi:hypothetical protein
LSVALSLSIQRDVSLSAALSIALTVALLSVVAFYQEMSLYRLLYRLACNLHWREEAALSVAMSFAQAAVGRYVDSFSIERSNFVSCSVSWHVAYTGEKKPRCRLSCLSLCRLLSSAPLCRSVCRILPEMTPLCRLVCRFLSRDDAAWIPLCRLLRRLP